VIASGLFIGKQIGVLSCAGSAVKAGWAKLPDGGETWGCRGLRCCLLIRCWFHHCRSLIGTLAFDDSRFLNGVVLGRPDEGRSFPVYWLMLLAGLCKVMQRESEPLSPISRKQPDQIAGGAMKLLTPKRLGGWLTRKPKESSIKKPQKLFDVMRCSKVRCLARACFLCRDCGAATGTSGILGLFLCRIFESCQPWYWYGGAQHGHC